MKPFFSIIIPVYNVAPYLRECLDSVLNQTFPEWEAICVDDGSTDGSGDILDEYAVSDSRFHVIHKENGGVSSARNAALDVAQGEWILFLDGDDLLNREAMKNIKNFLLCNKVDMVSFGTLKFNGKISRSLSELELVQFEIQKVEQVRDERHLLSYFASKCYNKSFLDGLFFNNQICYNEDGLFLAEYVARIKFVAITEEIFYYYRWHEDSATRQTLSFKRLVDYAYIAPRYFDALVKCPRSPAVLTTASKKIRRFTQGYVSELIKMPVEQRNFLWCNWFLMMESLMDVNDLMSRWHRFVVFICAKTKSRIIASFLCAGVLYLERFLLHVRVKGVFV